MVLAVAVLHRHPSVASRVESFLSDFRFQIFEISDRFSRCWSNVRLNFSQDTGEKIFSLQCENIRLKLQADRVDSLVAENNRLKSLLKMKESSKNEIIFAKVVDIINNDFVRSATINVGKKQNVQLDDFAYIEQGLVGRVIEVSDNWSKILFIIDANSNVPANISGVNALLSGDNSNLLRINLPSGDIKEGDTAKSSSYGKVFQEDIVIGKVVKKGDEFFVHPTVDFNRLKYVCIGKCQDR